MFNCVVFTWTPSDLTGEQHPPTNTHTHRTQTNDSSVLTPSLDDKNVQAEPGSPEATHCARVL